MTTCSESGQVRKEAAIRSLCRASESIECAGVFWCRGYPRVPAGRLVSRWSSASPAGSLDYQTPRRRPGPVVQKSPVKAHLSEELNPVFCAACWRCLSIDSCALQETAALPSVFTSKKRGPFPWVWLGKRASFVYGLEDWWERYALAAILSS